MPQQSTSKPAAPPKLSRLRRPMELPVEDWQVALRRQFGREQDFRLENLGDDSVFSEFAVTNPASGGRYRVAIRGGGLGENFCSCPDFATNDLGTCKHIEFTLGRIEARIGGAAALAQGFQPSYSEIYLNYAGQRSVRLSIGSACPEALAESAATLFGANGVLPPERYAELDAFLAAAQDCGHELRCHDDALNFIAEIRDGQARRRILDAAYPQGAASAALRTLLKADLYPYQAEGALFAASAGRCLIGDEMGLGKTIQAIAATELFARHFGAERVLVVCPTSLKHQWQREIARFTEREALVVAGSVRTRMELYRRDAFCKITNYETLARDRELIQSWAPDVVIVDEAQRIKNWNTIAARALKRIVSPYAIVLTGTPLENRLEELISIVQFVDQHRLGPTWRLLHEHQQRDELGRVTGYRDLGRIGATLAPVMVRRRKAEVLEQLPQRVDNTLFVALTPQQRVLHEENSETVARIVQRWRNTGFLSEGDQRRLTCALQNMRMVCNSTFLLDHETDHGHKADELAALLDDLFEQPDAKVVVFSAWVRTHELIARRLNQRGWGYVLFHGGVPGEKRGALVDRFRYDPTCRVFLSTDAGGVGLNLQHAAACIINMDMPWNPAVLEQRIGRVHRLGQTRSVQVINFVAQGSIEEGMLSVLAFKKSLFEGVLDGGLSEVSLHGTRLSKFMESVEQVAGATDKTVTEPEESLVEEAAPQPKPLTQSTPEEIKPEEIKPEEIIRSQPDQAKPEPSTQAADPWAPLLDAGLKLIESLTATQTAAPASPSPWVETDAKTGKSYLKLPVPDPDTLQRLGTALQGLLAGLRRD